MTTTNTTEMDDKSAMKKAMEAMGWDVSGSLPMANEENRRLLAEWNSLSAQKIELMEIDRQNAERVGKLQQHSKNAENTINHNLVSDHHSSGHHPFSAHPLIPSEHL